MDLAELQRENDALNEQVKLLVKTERRFYGAQRVIELQLRRLEALTRLATDAGGAPDPDRILELALRALLEVLDVDQAVALVDTSPTRSRVAAVVTQPGREPCDRRWQTATIGLPHLDRPMLIERPATAPPAAVAALLDTVSEHLVTGDRRSPRAAAIELVAPLRRKDGTQLGLIVLRRLTRTVSYHENLLSERDLPFVELVVSQVETFFENLLLYRKLASFAAGLERKVAERTADLWRANAQLARSLQRVRETRAQLVEASKRAAMLTLVAGLSHELNNPIGVILGYAQGLLADATDRLARRQLSAIERQARRCSLLVKALLGFAENRPLALDSLRPAILLQGVIAITAREAEERGVSVVIDPLEEDLPALHVSAESMREALAHLIKNALDATEPGGTVHLHARRRQRNGVQGVELTVRDHGGGIPRAFLSRIFDPFFTTKPPGKGVGLGLSLARRSIELHRGRIDVRSEIGRGTTALVWLPAAAERASEEASFQAESAR